MRILPLLPLLALLGCGAGDPTAEAESWVSARIRGDHAALADLSTPDLAEAIRASSSPLGEEFDPLARPELQVVSGTREGTSATWIVDATTHGHTVRYTLELRHDDGWRVASVRTASP